MASSLQVLIDSQGDAKLCDFGLVNTREVTAGTPNYMAPELFLAKPFSTSVDVFAFGVLLNEMWAREVPWDGYSPLDIRQKVRARAAAHRSAPRTLGAPFLFGVASAWLRAPACARPRWPHMTS